MITRMSSESLLPNLGQPGTAAPPRNEGAKQLREAADRVVGNVFFGKVLEQMRNSGLKGEYGHGGRGEDVFSAQLHQGFAEQLGAAARLPLSESLEKAYARQQGRIDRVELGE